jgi:hypothetical protein
MRKTNGETNTEATVQQDVNTTPESTEAVEASTETPSIEINERTVFDYVGVSPLNPKNSEDNWSYYWASMNDGSNINQLKMRGFDFVRVNNEREIPTWGGERREDGTVAYGGLILMKRPKEVSEKELEAKRRHYKRLANQKIEEAEEEMKREGAEHQPNRRTFYFAENPLAK